MWGPQVFRAIELDGKLCKVRINLWQALFRLRFENRSRILWIDALCINQADLNERNHQVTQMGKIYRNASTVVAWLGEPDSASSAAIKMLLEAGLGRASRVAYPILFRDCPTNALDAVHAIFLQEYWSRLWIVQEAECLRGGTFKGKNPSPEEANTRVRLSILYSVPIVNK
jgi:Heterokaryon incompatibility protein (HET)